MEILCCQNLQINELQSELAFLRQSLYFSGHGVTIATHRTANLEAGGCDNLQFRTIPIKAAWEKHHLTQMFVFQNEKRLFIQFLHPPPFFFQLDDYVKLVWIKDRNVTLLPLGTSEPQSAANPPRLVYKSKAAARIRQISKPLHCSNHTTGTSGNSRILQIFQKNHNWNRSLISNIFPVFISTSVICSQGCTGNRRRTNPKLT